MSVLESSRRVAVPSVVVAAVAVGAQTLRTPGLVDVSGDAPEHGVAVLVVGTALALVAAGVGATAVAAHERRGLVAPGAALVAWLVAECWLAATSAPPSPGEVFRLAAVVPTGHALVQAPVMAAWVGATAVAETAARRAGAGYDRTE